MTSDRNKNCASCVSLREQLRNQIECHGDHNDFYREAERLRGHLDATRQALTELLDALQPCTDFYKASTFLFDGAKLQAAKIVAAAAVGQAEQEDEDG